MPILKHYCIADIPGLGWLAKFNKSLKQQMVDFVEAGPKIAFAKVACEKGNDVGIEIEGAPFLIDLLNEQINSRQLPLVHHCS